MSDLFDVVAVDIKTKAERHLATGETKDNAEAIVRMAVMRRGCDKEFYMAVTAGTPLNPPSAVISHDSQR